jgi:threonine dehydratase
MNAARAVCTLPVGHADIAAAAERLAGHARRTPVMTSRTVDERTGARVFFKCENFQRMGAFKFRGAFNALAQLTPEQKRSGVLAYSSGNHAQAVALAGTLLGVNTVIVMPQDAPQVKLEATRGYGAEVITYDPATARREELAAGIAGERGMTVIPPYNHAQVVAGQGTAAMELIEETGPLDFLLVPCGGGGLLSGCAVAASHWSPGCKVIGVEPEAGDDATRSFRSKTLQTCRDPDTIADGARTPSLGTITFPLVLHYVHDMLTVSDAELLRSMFWIWERMKIVIEPTGALAAAALLEGKLDGRHDYKGRRIGVVISGGNADIKALCRLL